MKKLSLILVSFFIMTSISMAMPDEAAFGVTQNSKEWKQAEIEQWLVWRMSKDIGQFVPDDHFKIYAEVVFKSPSSTVRRVSNVSLAMLGTVATVVQSEPPKPQQGLFGQIASLNLTLVAANNLEAQTIEAMKVVMRSKIPIVPQDKVYITEARMAAPSVGFIGWVREFKTLITAAFLLLLMGWGLKSVLREIRIQGGLKIVPFQAPKARSVAKADDSLAGDALAVPLELFEKNEMGLEPGSVTAHVNAYMKEEKLPGLEDSLVAKNEQVAELRQMRSLMMTMTLSECREMVRIEKEWGPIALTILPKEKVAKVLDKLPESYRREVGLKALHWTPEKLKGRLDELKLVVGKYKGVDPRHHSSEKIAVFVEQVGVEKEAEVFDDLVNTEQFHRLAEVARHSPPYEVIRHVNSTYQAAALSRVPHSDRLSLLANGPDFIRVLKTEYLTTLNPKQRKQFESELATVQVESAGILEGRALSRYVNALRAAYRENWDIKRQVFDDIEKWLFKKTKGVVGGGHGKAA